MEITWKGHELHENHWNPTQRIGQHDYTESLGDFVPILTLSGWPACDATGSDLVDHTQVGVADEY